MNSSKTANLFPLGIWLIFFPHQELISIMCKILLNLKHINELTHFMSAQGIMLHI